MICCLISKSSIYSQPNEQYKISWNQKQEGLHNLAFTKATKLFQYPQRVQLTKFSLAFFSVNHRCNFVWINCDFSSAVNSVSSRESNFSCCWPVETDVGHCTMGPCWSWASCGWFLGVCCHFFWSFYHLILKNDWNQLSDILLILFLTVNLPGTFHQLNKHHSLWKYRVKTWSWYW